MEMHSIPCRFQFQTGAIKSRNLTDVGITQRGFNSKLVRLKVKESYDLHQPLRLFQFQTGAIKRRTHRDVDHVGIRSFNSKLVRLKVSTALSLSASRCFRFNSKLVRLKDQLSHGGPADELLFQFQTGAIKRWHANFSKPRHWCVSIPNWCD